MNTHAPRVTVAMPVYNGATTVARAIDSILQQTFRDFELVLIDDGCSDNTIDIVRSYNDPRIRLIAHETNQGLAATRNHLVDQARGEFIAWLDCDDWSHPERLARQVAVFSAEPAVALCSTWTTVIEERPSTLVRRRLRSAFEHGPTNDADLRANLIFRNVFATSTVMIRRSVVLDHVLQFHERYAPAEDYQMWAQMAQVGKVAVIPSTLGIRWEYASGASAKGWDRQMDAARRIRVELLEELGLPATNENIRLHQIVTETTSITPTRVEFSEAVRWLEQIEKWNESSLAFDPGALQRACVERFGFLVIRCAQINPTQLLNLTLRSRYSKYILLTFLWRLRQ